MVGITEKILIKNVKALSNHSKCPIKIPNVTPINTSTNVTTSDSRSEYLRPCQINVQKSFPLEVVPNKCPLKKGCK
ncbi:Uncharacterised protein [Mycoplasmopsis synoviae]|uniref:Uncharacterized protein n=1 Tax=Mycoplasmopsis synoviae TaxID=2109 RepID=A0A3B0PGX7_MYCSY|nr:Uncharacterised protein [Mycoplasmopsis synoviae]